VHRILLVDDDPDLLAMFARGFKPLSDAFEVATASSGGDASRQLAGSRFDVVVLDMLMPGKDGLETMAEVRKTHPTAKVIAMSGGAARLGLDVLGIARKLGAHGVLSKPFTHSQLVAEVRNVLGA
jgi:CheY-like chemotaxis protein